MLGQVLLASICTVPLFHQFHKSVTNSCKADLSLNTDGKILSLDRQNKLELICSLAFNLSEKMFF